MTRQQKTVAKILELKEFNTEQLEVETRNARTRLNTEEERLAQLDGEYRDRSNDLSRKQTEGTIAVHEMDLYYTYLKHLGKLIEKQKGIVAVRAAELDQRQRAMVAAYQEQRLLEKLQDKMLHEQVREAEQGEQKQADYQFLTRKGMK
jgi:flagellar export protein FliJ